jgi:STAS domain
MGTPSRATIVCDVRDAAASLRTLAALARLQLAARRVGGEIRLRRASPELRELLDVTGLGEVLRLEARREPEEREEPLGVEEERQLDDPAA